VADSGGYLFSERQIEKIDFAGLRIRIATSQAQLAWKTTSAPARTAWMCR